jgi:hypothetical protein
MIRIILFCLALFLGSAQHAVAAGLPPPTTSPSLAGNIGGVWYGPGFTFSNCTINGTGIISCPGTVSGYPASGIPQSTGSAWGSSVVLTPNQMLGELIAGTPAGVNIVSCFGPSQAAQWLPFFGWGCNAAIVAANGGVTAVGSPDGSLTIQQALGSPAIAGQPAAPLGSANGQLQARLNLGHANVWTAVQTFPNNSLTYAELPALALNQIIAGSATGAGVITMPSCSGSALALEWNTATGLPQCGPEVSTLVSPDNSVLISSLASASTLGPANSLAGQSGALQITHNAQKAYVWGDGQVLGTPSAINLKNATSASLPITAVNGPVSPYTNALQGSTDAFYTGLRKCQTVICRIVVFGDSEQRDAPVAHTYNLMPNLLRQAITAAGFPSHGTGFVPVTQQIGTVNNDNTCSTTGTPVIVNTVGGPQQTTGSPTGGSVYQMPAASTITCTPGIQFISLNISCALTSGSAGMALTINAVSVGTACAGTQSNTTQLVQTFTAPVACSTGTNCSFTLTAAASPGYVYAYEAVATAFGVAVDNIGEASMVSQAFTNHYEFSDQFPGNAILSIISIGVNDAGNSIAPATYTANLQNIIAHQQARGSSILLAGTSPYNQANWAGIAAAAQSLALTASPAIDWINFADSYPPATAAGATAAINSGLIHSDGIHPIDPGQIANADMVIRHLLGRKGQIGDSIGNSIGGLGASFYGVEVWNNATDNNATWHSGNCSSASVVNCIPMHWQTPSANWFQGNQGATAVTGLTNGAVISAGSAWLGKAAVGFNFSPTGYAWIADATTGTVSRPNNVIVLGAGASGSAYTNASNAFTTITDTVHSLSFALNATETSSFTCRIIYSASATTLGLAIQWTYSGTMTTFAATMLYNATLATAINDNVANVATAVSTQQPTTPTNVNAATTNYVAILDVDAITSTAGTLALQAKNSAAGTITVALGSRCEKK